MARKKIPKLLSQPTAIRVLRDHGWEQTLGGKHNVKMEKEGCRPITLPHHKGADYSRSLTEAILRAAGISREGS